jgi:hypothetical protein
MYVYICDTNSFHIQSPKAFPSCSLLPFGMTQDSLNICLYHSFPPGLSPHVPLFSPGALCDGAHDCAVTVVHAASVVCVAVAVCATALILQLCKLPHQLEHPGAAGMTLSSGEVPKKENSPHNFKENHTILKRSHPRETRNETGLRLPVRPFDADAGDAALGMILRRTPGTEGLLAVEPPHHRRRRAGVDRMPCKKQVQSL